MRFTIVVPSFNQADYLPACLDSLLDQNDVDLEILVYDGGSTDGSREIIERHADRLAYWQSQPDDGQAAAIRAGFDRATGEVLGWLNSDDILMPGALAHARDALQGNPDAGLVYGDAVWIDSQGESIRPKREISFDWNIFAYGYCYIPQPSAFFRREAYLAAGGVDPSFRCCMDYDLWHRLAKGGKVIHIPLFLSGLRDHPGTKTNQLKEVFSREHEILRRRYLNCGWLKYNVSHLVQRTRRCLLKWKQGCYRPLTAEEVAECGLNPRS